MKFPAKIMPKGGYGYAAEFIRMFTALTINIMKERFNYERGFQQVKLLNQEGAYENGYTNAMPEDIHS